MKTDAGVGIICATCQNSIKLYYSHESLAAKTLSDDIKHDATISSDWFFRDGMFYCNTCGESLENEREKTHLEQNSADWRMKVKQAAESAPYATAIHDLLFIPEG